MDFNGTQAAIRAGYSEKTAAAIGSQNLIKLNIQNEIKKMQDNLAETAGMGRLKLIKEHIKIAFSSIAHLHDTWIKRKDFESLTEDQKVLYCRNRHQRLKPNMNLILNYRKREPIRVEYVRIKLYDKQKALDSISKMLGYDAPIKMQVDLNAKGYA